MSRDSAPHESPEGRTGVALPAERAPAAAGPLPDVLSLDLATLRTVEHPVLAAVLDDLHGRVAQPQEMLWAFNSAC